MTGRATTCLLRASVLTMLMTGAAAGDPEVLDEEALFPEGPAVVDGTLYYAEYGGHTVTAWDGKNSSTLWQMDGCGPSAVIPFQGDLLVTCYDSNQIARISTGGETVELIERDTDGNGFVGPNDFAATGRDSVYMSASGPWESEPIVGKLYYIAREGMVRMVADDLHYANGLAVSEDDQRLYVIESEAGRVISFALADDGSLSDRRLFVRIGTLDEGSGPGAYPDGMEFGPNGKLYIGQYSSGRIVVVTPDGKLDRVIEIPSPAAPNLTFAPDGRSIYVMAVDQTDEAPYRGKVYRVPVE